MKFNFYNAGFAASALLAVLVLASELSKPFKDFLESIFTHHWVAKAILVAIAFVSLGYLLKKDKLFNIESEKLAWYSTLGSLAIIFLFYVYHFLA